MDPSRTTHDATFENTEYLSLSNWFFSAYHKPKCDQYIPGLITVNTVFPVTDYCSAANYPELLNKDAPSIAKCLRFVEFSFHHLSSFLFPNTWICFLPLMTLSLFLVFFCTSSDGSSFRLLHCTISFNKKLLLPRITRFLLTRLWKSIFFVLPALPGPLNHANKFQWHKCYTRPLLRKKTAEILQSLFPELPI